MAHSNWCVQPVLMAASKQTRLQLSRLGVCNVASVFALLGARAPLTTLPLRAQRERARPPSVSLTPTPPPARQQSQSSNSNTQSASLSSSQTTVTTCATSQTQSSRSAHSASASDRLFDRDRDNASNTDCVQKSEANARSPERDAREATPGAQQQRGPQMQLTASLSLTSAAVDPSSASRSSSATSALSLLPASVVAGVAPGGSEPPAARPATLVTHALVHSVPRGASTPTPTASPTRTPVADDNETGASVGAKPRDVPLAAANVSVAAAAAVTGGTGTSSVAGGSGGGVEADAAGGNRDADGEEWSLSVALPGVQTALVHVADWVTVRRLSARLCAEAHLDAQQHYLRVHLAAHGIDYIPDANERVAALVASAGSGSSGERFELVSKAVFRCVLLPHPETEIGSTGSSVAGDCGDANRFGLQLKARLRQPSCAHSHAETDGNECGSRFCAKSEAGRLAVQVKRVAQDGPAECAGLLVDDEVLAINEQLTADLDMMFVEQLLAESERLVLVVRSCRDRPPPSSRPLDPSELFLLQSRAPSVPRADNPEAYCREPTPTPIHSIDPSSHQHLRSLASIASPTAAAAAPAASGFNIQQAFASSLAPAADQSLALASNPLLCEHLGLANAHTIDSEGTTGTDSSVRPPLGNSNSSITPGHSHSHSDSHSTADCSAPAGKLVRSADSSQMHSSATTSITSASRDALDRTTTRPEAALQNAPLALVESSATPLSQQEDALTTSTESGSHLFPRAMQPSGPAPATATATLLAVGGGGGGRSSVSSASGSGSSASGGGGRLTPVEKLERAVHELLSTERRYVSDLELLLARYLLPLRSHLLQLQHQHQQHPTPAQAQQQRENGGSGAALASCTGVRVEVGQLADTVADLHRMHAALLEELERERSALTPQQPGTPTTPPLNTAFVQAFEVLSLLLIHTSSSRKFFD